MRTPYQMHTMRSRKIGLWTMEMSYSCVFFLQVLTTLYLHQNQIGDSGAQQLADALKVNKV